MHACGIVEYLHILRSLHVTFWINNFWTAGMAVVQHLTYHHPANHIFLTLQQWKPLCGPIWRDKWLHTGIATITSCAEPCNRLSPPLQHKQFSLCHTEHGGPSGYIWNTTVHKQIHLVYSNSQKLIEWSEVQYRFGDFLATLYDMQY
jgi:hypothetical protein